MAVHGTAHIDSSAQIADGVTIGPHVVIEGNVRIGSGTIIEANALIGRFTRMGCDNHVHMGAVIGHHPQDFAFDPKTSSGLCVGDRNVFREYVTIHRGTKEDTETVIGNDCYLMVNAHVAHNCVLKDNVVMANGAMLGGYVHVGDGAFISGLVAVHQFVRIGAYAMIGGQSAINKDLPPFMLAAGRPAAVSSVNIVGLRRAQFSKDRCTQIRRYFKIMYRAGLNTTQVMQALERESNTNDLEKLQTFIRNSERGICWDSHRKKHGEPVIPHEADDEERAENGSC